MFKNFDFEAFIPYAMGTIIGIVSSQLNLLGIALIVFVGNFASIALTNLYKESR